MKLALLIFAGLLGLFTIILVFIVYPFLKDIRMSQQPCKDTAVYTSVSEALAHKDTACDVWLGSRGLTTVPPELQQLPHLRILILSHNAFSSFPEEVTKLHTLVRLDLSNNNLGSIPPSIGALKELRILNLDETNIADLPKEIGELPKLEVITLSGNQFTKRPAVLENTKRKIIVDYTYNPFPEDL